MGVFGVNRPGAFTLPPETVRAGSAANGASTPGARGLPGATVLGDPGLFEHPVSPSGPALHTPEAWAPIASKGLSYATEQRSPSQALRHWLKGEHHAFGDPGNAIQYGYEHEGDQAGGGRGDKRWGLLQYYRPEEIADADWAKMPLDDRLGYLKEKNPFKSTLDVDWRGLVRTDAAPRDLQPLSEMDGAGHETKPAKPYARLMDLLDGASFAKRRIEPQGRTQYNTSFRHNPAYARELTDFIAQASEYATMRMFAGSPKSVSNWRFGFYTQEGLGQMRAQLAAPTPAGIGKTFKFYSFAPRSGPLYGEGRLNLELRAITNNVPDARRVVVATDRFLEDPHGALVKLGRKGPGYRMHEVASVDRLSSRTLQRLPSNVRERLEQVAKQAPGSNELSVMGTTPLELHWASPMVSWEARPGVPPEVQARIHSERRTYLETLQQLTEARGMPAAEMSGRINEAVHRFAKRTGIHDYL